MSQQLEFTSLLAWHRLVESGKLSKRRATALRHLIISGPMTAQELTVTSQIPGLWKRLSELERLGFVRVTGIRTCKVTQETAKVWESSL